MKNPHNISMTQKEYSDTLSRNSNPHRYGTRPQLSYRCITGVQRSDNSGFGTQRSDRPARTKEVLNEATSSTLIGVRVLGSGFILAHLFSLAAYSIFGLSSRDENNYSSIFVYGGSLITLASYFVLYGAGINTVTSSVFERGQGESTGTYCAKAGLMGIVLPVFNFVGLIVVFIKVGQDGKTFWSGIAVFIAYLLGNVLLFMSKGENTESEEHELGEDNPPADNATVSNLPVANLPEDYPAVDNVPTANTPSANLSVDTLTVDNLPAANPSVDTSR